MKKSASQFTLLLSLVSFAYMAQETRIQPCNTQEAMEQRFAMDQQAKKDYEKHLRKIDETQLRLEQEYKTMSAKSAAAVEYTVPVVFHILYDCTNPNAGVTDAVCNAALQQVNSDYSRSGSDTNLIFAPFKSLYINSDIKFMLAKKDPQGNCINGIVRHYDSKTVWSQATANTSNSYYTYTWDPTRYLNIYVVSKIMPTTPQAGVTVVGYTYRPGTWPTGNTHDAIVYDGNFLSGSQGGIPDARNLSHEIGHWLDLGHTFGSTNNPGAACGSTFGGDGISDTPDTKGNFSNCPAASTNTNYICTSPNPTNSANYYQNVNNFMDYSSCSRNFTSGQTLRMRTTLTTNTNGRDNLTTLANLAFTNVDGSGLCAPKADFGSTNCSYTTCAGSNLTFKDLSYNGAITGYTWVANNGAVIASANASITSINFPNLGTVNITLQVANAQGSSSKSMTVSVLDGASAIIGAYSESFETPGVPTDWTVFNVNNDALTWAQTEIAAYDQSASFFMERSTNAVGKVDILQMPTLDVYNNQGKVLEFAYAYRQNASTQNDELRVQASKDCGGTWTDIWVPSAATLANGSGGVSSDEFIPFPEEWKVYQISGSPYWSNFQNSTSVLVRYMWTVGSGAVNNFFIDAVRYYSASGINELTSSIKFSLFPNPSNGESTVRFTLNDPATIKMSVLDIMGREVIPATEAIYPAGEQNISINKDQTLAKGVYFVNLSHNGAKMSAKLIIH